MTEARFAQQARRKQSKFIGIKRVRQFTDARRWKTPGSGGPFQMERLQILFVLILLLGILARVWEFGSLPPGLNQDEASAAVDAYSIYRYGVDSNGVPFPAYLVAFGSGMSALYSYVMIPFIAIGGLTPITERIPVLISALLTLPVMYWVGKRIGGRLTALIAMFLLAISPWHIIMSRWGHEANFLPFVFIVGFAFLLESSANNWWFVAAASVFAVSLYGYAPALATVPIFLAFAIPVLVFARRLTFWRLAAGLAVFAVVTTPIALFVIVNSLRLDGLRLGIFSIPRLPSRPRYEDQAAFFSGAFLHALKVNALQLGSLLWNQTDRQPWNVVEPYGYFYRYTAPVAAAGAVLTLPRKYLKESPERLLLLCWLAASVTTGLLQPANINRVNLIFMPLILFTAVCLDWLGRHWRPALPIGVALFLVSFLAFTRDYHGARYREQLNGPFFTGFLEALDFARKASDNPICVTDRVNMPYIFVLFGEQMNPAEYLPGMVYDDPRATFRMPRRLDRYRFGLKNCTNHSDGTVYVLQDELPLTVPESYTVTSFGAYHVFVP